MWRRRQALASLAAPSAAVLAAGIDTHRVSAAAPAVSVSPTSVRQGRTLLVWIEADEAASRGISARFGPAGIREGVPLHVFASEVGGARLLALAGVPVDAVLGGWEVAVETRGAVAADGPVPTESVGVEVTEGGFPAQRVGFAGELLSLLDPAVGEEERLTLATVIAASESTGTARWRGRFRLPVMGRLVTAHGARRDYLDPSGRLLAHWQHGGVDIAVPAGTPIAAPAAGVVAFAGRWSIRGNVVVVDHGAGVHSVHAHAAQLAIAVGQTVVPGQVLGWVGSTGLSTGPHLHWEVRVGGVGVDPLEWTQRQELGLV